MVKQPSYKSRVLRYLCCGLVNGLVPRQPWVNVWASQVWKELGGNQLGVKNEVVPHSCEQSAKYDLVSIRVEAVSVDASRLRGQAEVARLWITRLVEGKAVREPRSVLHRSLRSILFEDSPVAQG